MVSDWEEVTLSELVDFTPKRTIKKNTVAPFISMADVTENCKFITEVFEKEYTGGGSRFSNGDTLFARITPCLQNGKNSKVSGMASGAIGHGSTEFIVLAAKNPKYDEDFIYYLTRLPAFRAYAESRMIGSTGRQRVSWQDLAEYELFVPTQIERKNIGAFLSSLDDKIELNRQMNETLEAMAQALFKSWFVDFDPVIDNALAAGNPIPDEFLARAKQRQALPKSDSNTQSIRALFPNAFEFTEEMGWIPEGWEVDKLGKYIEVKRGGSPRPIHDYLVPDGLPWVKISDATASNSRFLVETKQFIKPEGLKKTTLLKKGSLVLSNSATPGLPKFLDLDACIHDGWLHFPKKIIFTDNYLYQLFLIVRQELLMQGNGSVFTNLKTDILKNHMVVVPNIDVLNYFDNWISSFHNKIHAVQIEVDNLSKIRDTLLPKLLSGELRITDAAAMIEEV